jgi:hypothetical protein
MDCSLFKKKKKVEVTFGEKLIKVLYKLAISTVLRGNFFLIFWVKKLVYRVLNFCYYLGNFLYYFCQKGAVSFRKVYRIIVERVMSFC